MNMDRLLPPLIFALLIMGLYCATSFSLAAVGGWRRIAKSFPASHQPNGKWFYWQSGAVGPVGYGNCLTVCSSDEGLYLAVLLPLRLGHPPLLIPWNDVDVRRIQRILWWEKVEFYVGSPVVGTMQLPKKVFEGYLSIEEQLGR
jgi:hypothetical protein